MKSDKAVIASGENYPNALAIAPFAAKKQYPILLTEKSSLNSDVKKVLKDWNIKNAIILGRDDAVSQKVYDEISSMGISVKRLAGNDNYLTALDIIKYFSSGGFSGIYVVNGEDFAGALACGPLAAKNNYPIFMVGKDKIDPSVLQYIKDLNLGNKTYILGGPETVSDKIAYQIPSKNDSRSTNPGSANQDPGSTGAKTANQGGADFEEFTGEVQIGQNIEQKVFLKNSGLGNATFDVDSTKSASVEYKGDRTGATLSLTDSAGLTWTLKLPNQALTVWTNKKHT